MLLATVLLVVGRSVLHFLNMYFPWQRRVLDYTKYEMLNKALEAFGDLGEDEELGPADWPTVKRYIASLNNIEGEPVHPHAPEEDNNLDQLNLKDIRVRLLNGKLINMFAFYSTHVLYPIILTLQH